MKESIRTFTNFRAFLDSLLTDIQSAEHHIHMQFFKFEDDSVGRMIGEVMSSRAKAGIPVRLLYDDFCCHKWRTLYRDLESKGVETVGYEPLFLPFFKRSNYYRNHRKTIVIDGRIAYLGGMNVAERYLNGLDWGCWRDTMIRIEGSSAGGVQLSFLTDWNTASKQMVNGCEYYPLGDDRSESPVEIITSNPISKSYCIMDKTIEIIDSAEHYIWFESPYFIPPREVKRSMLAAVRRGVDLRILQPPRGDRGETTQLATKQHYAEFLEAGAKIGHYDKGYLHAKTIVCDDRVAMIGSCNIDPRSYRLCHEIAAVIHDETCVKEQRDIFLDDEGCSTYIDLSEWKKRPVIQKIKEKLASVISSQL